MNKKTNNKISKYEWYIDKPKDKFVSNLSAAINESRNNKSRVGLDKYKVKYSHNNKEQSVDFRRYFWLKIAMLTYCEKSSDIYKVLSEVDDLLNLNICNITSHMFTVLKINCYLSLTKNKVENIHLLSSDKHDEVLYALDAIISFKSKNSEPYKPLCEDYALVSNVAEDIEKLIGKELYSRQPKGEDYKNVVSELVPANPEEHKLSAFLINWVGSKTIINSGFSLSQLLEKLRFVKYSIDIELGINSKDNTPNFERSFAYRRSLVSANRRINVILSIKGHPIQSFWKKYIELITNRTMVLLNGSNNRKGVNLIREAARWTLQDNMILILGNLLSDQSYLRTIVKQRIIDSESLLYAIFSWLSTQQFKVEYSGYTTSTPKSKGISPDLYLFCGGERRVFESMIPYTIYNYLSETKDVVFDLELSNSINKVKQHTSLATFLANDQLIIIGLQERILLDGVAFSGKEVLRELLALVGISYSRKKHLRINFSESNETFEIKTIKSEYEKPSSDFISFLLKGICYKEQEPETKTNDLHIAHQLDTLIKEIRRA